MEATTKKEERKYRVDFTEFAQVGKMHIKDVFFFQDELNESEYKSLEQAQDKSGNVTHTGTLGYILRHHGWVVTNLLNDNQIKAQRLSNQLKRKVFSVVLNKVYFLTTKNILRTGKS